MAFLCNFHTKKPPGNITDIIDSQIYKSVFWFTKLG